jgi:FkbM family methyltransferase
MFEVDPLKLSLLRMSIKLNSFETRVTVIPKAVSDLPSQSQVLISSNTSSQVAADKFNYDSNIYSVETISLNNFKFPSQIYLLRVDVEGYEIHVELRKMIFLLI